MSANKIVLTQEEIQSLVSLQQKQNEFIIQLGQIEYQVNSLEEQKKEIKKLIDKFEKDQSSISVKLKEKYGEGTINLENGEFVKA